MQKIKLKLNKVDLLIILICFTGAFFSGAAFWKEYNNTLVKLNENPVGIIIFKKRVAQRRFVDRNVWDRLQQTSPIYNGDMIRTIEQSEAVIVFQDETAYLSMDENTIIQVYYNNEGETRIDFSDGNMELVSENTNIIISSGDSTIIADGQIRMNKFDDEIVLSVLKGKANFDGTKIDEGGALAFDSAGNISTKPIITMTSFGHNAYVLGLPSEAVPVTFSWNEFNFDRNTHVIVEIAFDRNFRSIAETRYQSGITSVSIPLQSGSYWWRVYPVSSGSREPLSRLFPAGTLEVIPAEIPHIISPPHASELAFLDEPKITLSWSAMKEASAYLVEISSNADMSYPVISRRIHENSVVQTGLNFGRWFWRVTPEFPAWFKGSGTSSAIGEFTASQGYPDIEITSKTYLPAPPSFPPVVFRSNTEDWDDLDSETRANNEKIISQIVSALNTYNEYKLSVEGHSNHTVAINDAEGRILEQNLELLPLGEIRAKSVVDRLIKAGADPKRISYRSLGGDHPVAAWEDKENWWKNRRVEFIFQN